MDEDEVRRLVLEHFGEMPRRLARMRYGHDHVTYSVGLRRRTLIVRTDRRPASMAAVEHNLAHLRALGLPVPDVIAADLSARDYPAGYVVLAKIPGRDLGFALGGMRRVPMKDVAARVADAQRRVATLPEGRGFGWAPVGAPGTYPSWTALIEANLEGILAQLPSDRRTAGVDRLVACVRDARAHLDAVPSTPFLDDVTTKNVIVRSGRLQGFVDFDCICYGDPVYWLALTRTAVATDCPAPAGYYVAELCRAYGLRSDQRPLLELYTALHHVQFVTRAGPTTAARLLAALDGLLDGVAALSS